LTKVHGIGAKTVERLSALLDFPEPQGAPEKALDGG
jgi:hypothetical protein